MDLSGTWQNELGSILTIQGQSGSITGTYQTTTGTFQGTFDLVGSYDANPAAGNVALGWVVAWQNDTENAHSVTTWSGLYFPTYDAILAVWLLTTEQSDDADYWAATNVGEDVFLSADAERPRIPRNAAHPVAAR